jgi:hypothetical protein
MKTNSLSPSSINKKQSADSALIQKGLSDHEIKVQRNRKRGLRIATNARANTALYSEVCNYINNADLNNDELMYFVNLRRALSTCCQHSLVRKWDNGGMEYVASQTCKHKLCVVCNAERAKALRRKYLSYFRKNQFIDRKTGEVQTKDQFDYMHLTLTVPHTAAGWNGKQWYAQDLMKAFNTLRKRAWWLYYVWGGEFGIEVTKNASGLHIHIHSMLIVRKEEQSRNILQRLILLEWNELTADKASNREAFTALEVESIRRGCRTLTDADMLLLNPKGATLIGLESLYVLKSKKQGNNDRWQAESGKWKHYIDPTDEKDFMAGVLECLKYHFEPVAFDKTTGIYEFDLLREILPNIFRKPLYRKFGNLHGVKELNINDSNDLHSEIGEAVEELGDIPTNPETGQTDSAYCYVVVSARNIFYDLKNNLKPSIADRARYQVLQADNIHGAVQCLIDMSIAGRRRKELQINNENIAATDEYIRNRSEMHYQSPELSDLFISDDTDIEFITES